MKQGLLFTISLAWLCLGGCSFEPPYERPFVAIPEIYKEDDTWKRANPSYVNAGIECWWEIFDDPILNQLEEELNEGNQELDLALAKYEGALSALKVNRADLYPTIDGDAHAIRQKLSTTVANPPSDDQYNDFLLGTDLSYEIDLWGRVRNLVKASRLLARASRDDYAAVKLSLEATLASAYFSLRGSQENIRILTELEKAYVKALELTNNRFVGGISPEIDVLQAKTQLENVKTLALEEKLRLAQFEHAIAVLVGKVPATFCIDHPTRQAKMIAIAPILPSCLLQRRPDIAAAQRRTQAANAAIGVARAAFFPNVNLIGTVLGLESASLGSLFNANSLYWTVGPSALMTLFDGGRLQGQLNQATSNYHETVAIYRQTVLTAFQEVEDNLAAQRLLEKANITQAAATKAAHQAVDQINYRYEGGIATYLDVVIEQNTALNADLALTDIHTRRQIATVQLIKALGGGWDNIIENTTLPIPCELEEIQRFELTTVDCP